MGFGRAVLEGFKVRKLIKYTKEPGDVFNTEEFWH
jgi:hypothetical protein